MQATLFVSSHGSQNPSIIEYKEEADLLQKGEIVSRCMRAFEWDSLAGQIYLCEDLYLE